MNIPASPNPAYPYVILSIESDDYGTGGISIQRSSKLDSATAVTIGSLTANELFPADDKVFIEAVNIVAADGGEEKLIYHINGQSSQQISVKDILDNEVHSTTFAAMLRHDPIYNAAMAQRAKVAEVLAQQTAHHVIYYRYAAEDAAPVSVDPVTANTYDGVKSEVTATLGLSETEDAAYKVFVDDAGNAGKDPILGKYAVEFTHDVGTNPLDPTDDTYSAEATEIPSPVPDFNNLEVCLPITLNQ